MTLEIEGLYNLIGQQARDAQEIIKEYRKYDGLYSGMRNENDRIVSKLKAEINLEKQQKKELEHNLIQTVRDHTKMKIEIEEAEE